MEEVPRYSHCFICGHENPHGVQARFFFDGEQVHCQVVATAAFEGYNGIYHGGVMAALLDEVMVKVILSRRRFALTAEMTVRYHRPVRVGDRLTFTGKVTESRGRIHFAEARATDPEGNALASATGKYIEAKDDLRAELLNSLD